MKKVTVITGGAGGIGLATAKIVGLDHHVLLCDVNQQRLAAAVASLEQMGIGCTSMLCDVSHYPSVDAVLRLAAEQGTVVSAIHTAGMSPQMGDAATIIKVNALGTIHLTEACYEIAADGFALVNVASMAAYMLPGLLVPRRAYSYAFSDKKAFLKKMLFLCQLMPRGLVRTAVAYIISKNFVVWYSRKNAARFGQKNSRILSVSPGSIDTDMGRLEEKSGSAALLKHAALKRFGKPEEIAELLAFCASDKASYLTGSDILCDGGVIAGRIHS